MFASVLRLMPGPGVAPRVATLEVAMPWHTGERRAAVRGLLRQLARHDPDTARHCLRVRRSVLKAAGFLGLTRQQRRLLAWAAALHDVGKLAVPLALLRKRGPLAAAEFSRVRQHPALGERLLAPFIRHPLVLRSVRHHHESFDGTGYPDGLAGRQIPWPARLVALADCFDALTHARPYRAAGDRAEALAYLRSQAGRRFDPALTAQFVRAMTAEPERRVIMCDRIAPILEDAVRQPADTERRTDARYPCSPERAGRVVVSDGHAASWARPRDVSAGGIGLVTAHPYEPGTVLAIRFRALREDPGLFATVIHAQGEPDGTWLVGCAFDRPLPPGVLGTFL